LSDKGPKAAMLGRVEKILQKKILDLAYDWMGIGKLIYYAYGCMLTV